MRERLREIDSANGIAISLVVLGHMVFLKQGGITWYANLFDFIYLFHMPFFFFLTGFLFFYTKDIDSLSYHHFTFVRSKFLKFAPPYLFFSILFLLGEFAFSQDRNQFIHSLPYNVYLLIFEPIKSYPTFLWFVYVLFLFYASVPLLLKMIGKKRRFYLVILSFILPFLPFIKFPGCFSLNLYVKYLPFFLTGMLYAQQKARWDIYIKKYGSFFVVLLISAFIIKCYSFYIHSVIISLISIPAILLLSSRKSCLLFLFAKIGRNSFAIYMQNMTIVGAIYLMLTRLFFYDAAMLQFFVPVFFFCSIGIPMYLEKLLPSRFSYGRKLLGYVF